MFEKIYHEEAKQVSSHIKVDSPCTIEIMGGVHITIDADMGVTVKGHSKLSLETTGDIDISGKNVSIQAENNLYIGSGEHLVQQSKRIDLNPEKHKSGYRK
jgi:hypothetical protein